LGDAGLDEGAGDAFLGAVALDPDLVVDDLDVQEAAVDALGAHPALRDDEVAGVLLVEDGLVVDVAVGVADVDVLPQAAPDDGSVVGHGVHRSTSLRSGSNTSRRILPLSRSISPIGNLRAPPSIWLNHRAQFSDNAAAPQPVRA